MTKECTVVMDILVILSIYRMVIRDKGSSDWPEYFLCHSFHFHFALHCDKPLLFFPCHIYPSLYTIKLYTCKYPPVFHVQRFAFDSCLYFLHCWYSETFGNALWFPISTKVDIKWRMWFWLLYHAPLTCLIFFYAFKCNKPLSWKDFSLGSWALDKLYFPLLV